MTTRMAETWAPTLGVSGHSKSPPPRCRFDEVPPLRCRYATACMACLVGMHADARANPSSPVRLTDDDDRMSTLREHMNLMIREWGLPLPLVP